MARSTVRITRDEGAIQRARRAAAEGFLAVVEAIRDEARPPDAPPFGEGLVETSAVGVWLDGQQIAGDAERPAGLELPPGIVGVIGFDSPARYQEIGTVNHGAQPFLTPAANRIAPGAPGVIARVASSSTR